MRPYSPRERTTGVDFSSPAATIEEGNEVEGRPPMGRKRQSQTGYEKLSLLLTPEMCGEVDRAMARTGHTTRSAFLRDLITAHLPEYLGENTPQGQRRVSVVLREELAFVLEEAARYFSLDLPAMIASILAAEGHVYLGRGIE